jgi:hypothetical protein
MPEKINYIAPEKVKDVSKLGEINIEALEASILNNSTSERTKARRLAALASIDDLQKQGYRYMLDSKNSVFAVYDPEGNLVKEDTANMGVQQRELYNFMYGALSRDKSAKKALSQVMTFAVKKAPSSEVVATDPTTSREPLVGVPEVVPFIQNEESDIKPLDIIQSNFSPFSASMKYTPPPSGGGDGSGAAGAQQQSTQKPLPPTNLGLNPEDYKDILKIITNDLEQNKNNLASELDPTNMAKRYAMFKEIAEAFAQNKSLPAKYENVPIDGDKTVKEYFKGIPDEKKAAEANKLMGFAFNHWGDKSTTLASSTHEKIKKFVNTLLQTNESNPAAVDKEKRAEALKNYLAFLDGTTRSDFETQNARIHRDNILNYFQTYLPNDYKVNFNFGTQQASSNNSTPYSFPSAPFIIPQSEVATPLVTDPLSTPAPNETTKMSEVNTLKKPRKLNRFLEIIDINLANKVRKSLIEGNYYTPPIKKNFFGGKILKAQKGVGFNAASGKDYYLNTKYLGQKAFDISSVLAQVLAARHLYKNPITVNTPTLAPTLNSVDSVLPAQKIPLSVLNEEQRKISNYAYRLAGTADTTSRILNLVMSGEKAARATADLGKSAALAYMEEKNREMTGMNRAKAQMAQNVANQVSTANENLKLRFSSAREDAMNKTQAKSNYLQTAFGALRDFRNMQDANKKMDVSSKMSQLSSLTEMYKVASAADKPKIAEELFALRNGLNTSESLFLPTTKKLMGNDLGVNSGTNPISSNNTTYLDNYGLLKRPNFMNLKATTASFFENPWAFKKSSSGLMLNSPANK